MIEKEGKPSNFFTELDGYELDLWKKKQDDLKSVLLMQMDEAKRRKEQEVERKADEER